MVRVHNIPVLEKHLTVAVWVQRGAGMSYAAREPESGMTVEQFIADAHELTLLLAGASGSRRSFWSATPGAVSLGALTVHRFPDLYFAYVGVGQVVDMREGERISYASTLAQAEKAGNARSLQAPEIKVPVYFLEGRYDYEAPAVLAERYFQVVKVRGLRGGCARDASDSTS